MKHIQTIEVGIDEIRDLKEGKVIWQDIKDFDAIVMKPKDFKALLNQIENLEDTIMWLKRLP